MFTDLRQNRVPVVHLGLVRLQVVHRGREGGCDAPAERGARAGEVSLQAGGGAHLALSAPATPTTVKAAPACVDVATSDKLVVQLDHRGVNPLRRLIKLWLVFDVKSDPVLKPMVGERQW